MQPETVGYPLATNTWDDAELQAMQEVIRIGQFTMGEHVARFEQDFAQYVGSRYCVMVNSGSSANLLMVAALFYDRKRSLKAGDEVIVPAVSWATTYYPLYQYGLKLKFIDIDRDTLNFDLDQLANAITHDTRMIFAVNLLGNPNDFDRIREIIGERDILLIEDNCESMGAKYKGQQAGTFGIMGSFSTFFSHHISTMEGGMIVTDDEELYQILLSLRAHGWTRNLPRQNFVCGTKSDDPFKESFRFVLPGYNLRPLELSGAVGSVQLTKLPEFILVRQENARKFLKLLSHYTHLLTQKETGKSSWFGFSMLVAPGAPFSRQQLLKVLHEHQVESRPVVAGNFAKNKVVSIFDYSIHGCLSNADYVDEHGLFIGNHHFPLDREFGLLQRALDALETRNSKRGHGRFSPPCLP
jgi:CDP-6-deoxy-D-xylo-4-hexulose-3-dehydrase